MYDEQQLEETQSAHSIGIVENPLYVEEEGTFSTKEVIFMCPCLFHSTKLMSCMYM